MSTQQPFEQGVKGFLILRCEEANGRTEGDRFVWDAAQGSAAFEAFVKGENEEDLGKRIAMQVVAHTYQIVFHPQLNSEVELEAPSRCAARRSHASVDQLSHPCHSDATQAISSKAPLIGDTITWRESLKL